MSVTDRPRAIVTGASRGIGATLAKKLRSEFEVIGTGRIAAKNIIALDLENPEAPFELARQLEGKALDLLVCNAGIYLDKGESLDDGYPATLWSTMFQVNVTSVFLLVQALLPRLKQAQQPKIAIISSLMASQARAPGGSYAYRASKAAVLNLGRNLACDLRSDGIAVGIFHPGWVRTDMGGAQADLSVEQSAFGLYEQITALELRSSGDFINYDGSRLPL